MCLSSPFLLFSFFTFTFSRHSCPESVHVHTKKNSNTNKPSRANFKPRLNLFSSWPDYSSGNSFFFFFFLHLTVSALDEPSRPCLCSHSRLSSVLTHELSSISHRSPISFCFYYLRRWKPPLFKLTQTFIQYTIGHKSRVTYHSYDKTWWIILLLYHIDYSQFKLWVCWQYSNFTKSDLGKWVLKLISKWSLIHVAPHMRKPLVIIFPERGASSTFESESCCWTQHYCHSWTGGTGFRISAEVNTNKTVETFHRTPKLIELQQQKEWFHIVKWVNTIINCMLNIHF